MGSDTEFFSCFSCTEILERSQLNEYANAIQTLGPGIQESRAEDTAIVKMFCRQSWDFWEHGKAWGEQRATLQ